LERRYDWPLAEDAFQVVAKFLSEHLHANNSRAQNDLCSHFGLEEFVHIEKQRSTYVGDGIEVCLDEVSGLGSFIEVEAVGSTGVAAATRFCSQKALTNLPLGYVELWLRKHDFQTYRCGRYLLAQDRTV
jgi:hypothetical protein